MTTARIDHARAALTSPDPAARPMMRWWWFGPDVEDAEIDRELRAMAAAGLGGAEVSFVYPLREGSEEFLSAAMLGHLRHAAETARELGLRLDVTLGSGWSYGGGHIDPEHASRRLRWERRDLSPAALEVPITSPWPGDELVAAYLGEGFPPADWSLLERDGEVLRIPAGRGPRTVLLAWSELTGQQVKRSSAGAEGPVLDHYSAEATRHHLQVVGEPLLEAVPGEMLGSVFCDSLEVYGANWTAGLPAEFARRRGYELLPVLHRLQIDEPGSAELRIDVGRTLGELVEENFVATCSAWAREHGTRFRLQGYGQPPITLSGNRSADLIEGEGWGWDGLPQTRWASSAAHLDDREVVSSEIWTWVHSPSFRATPLDLKGEAHEHLLLGINHVVGHGWPYSPPEVPGMGWYFYASGALDDRNPWWPAMPELTAYLTRLCSLLRLGRPIAEVKVYLPSDDVRAAHGAGFDLWRACREHIGPEIPAAIRRAGHDLDLVDDAALKQLAPEDAPVVVLPEVTSLPAGTGAWLDAVREAGGIVLAVGADASLACPAYPAAMPATRASFAAVLEAALPPDTALEGDGGEIGVVHRRLADGDLLLVANTGNSLRTVRVRPRALRAEHEQWDARTGTIRPATWDGDALQVTLHPYEATVLVGTGEVREDGAAVPAPWFASGAAAAPVGGSATPGAPEPAPAAGSTARTLDGPWRYAPGDTAGPAALGEVTLPHRWAEHGTGGERAGTYETTIHLTAEDLAGGERLVLDLGPGAPLPNTARQPQSYRALLAAPVREVAEVLIDGEVAGLLWDAPYRLDLTDHLREGENTLRLVVRSTAAAQVAADEYAEGIIAESRRVYGRRFDQQDLDLALDQVDPGLHVVPTLRREPRPVS
ncbi:glycosyl hydrolase [Brachybacterium sp. YJGR34]|uniref:glycosyl hydrolase n=1 Tax=Brachybacterium sp. YJGR34 TaxID=2059911 RepID=UPI000E0BDC0A|nr:glycosyl hydrolase [Brachybacterium sp. YJGR34]